jgi:hypothetical protein
LLNEIIESEALDERTHFEKLGLIDYDHSDLQEIKAENDLKVKNYLDSLNHQQRQHLLSFYNKGKSKE